jgi:hypothetical protein
LREFHRSLQRLRGLASGFDFILPAHAELGALPLSKQILDDLVQGIKLILAGKLVGQEEKTLLAIAGGTK